MKKYLLIFVIIILFTGGAILYVRHHSEVRNREMIRTICPKGEVRGAQGCAPIDLSKVLPFTDAGCFQVQNSYSEGILNCMNASFSPQFYCKGYGIIDDIFGLPMISCGVSANGKEGVNEETYFSCSGGLARQCNGLLMYKDSKFIEIKNEQELLTTVGSIKTPEQAKWLVRHVELVESSVRQNIKKAPEVTPTFENGIFIVTAYSRDIFGCFSPKEKYSVYKVIYTVTTDGVITEKSREVAYTYRGNGSCVD